MKATYKVTGNTYELKKDKHIIMVFKNKELIGVTSFNRIANMFKQEVTE